MYSYGLKKVEEGMKEDIKVFEAMKKGSKSFKALIFCVVYDVDDKKLQDFDLNYLDGLKCDKILPEFYYSR